MAAWWPLGRIEEGCVRLRDVGAMSKCIAVALGADFTVHTSLGAGSAWPISCPRDRPDIGLLQCQNSVVIAFTAPKSGWQKANQKQGDAETQSLA